MGRSQRLRLNEVRAVFRLVDEVRELGQDPSAWRRHMLRELCCITATAVGVGVEVAAPVAGCRPGIVDQADVGWAGERERALWAAYMRAGDLSDDPSWPAIERLSARTFTRRRRLLVDDAAWYGSAHVNHFRRSIGVDDFVLSAEPLAGQGVVHYIGLHRAWGEKPTGHRDARLLALFHAELRRLWELAPGRRQGLPQSPLAGLPPRQRQILDLLRAGEAEKQIALKLHLSRHTVHNHIAALHRRLGVQSRGELLTAAGAAGAAAPTVPLLSRLPPHRAGPPQPPAPPQ